MTNLTIITPLTRPHNLERIAQSLRAARDFFDVTWYIVHDCRSGSCDFPVPDFVTVRLDHVMSSDGDCAGHHQANVALTNIHEGLVWRCDDDNLPVDGFFRRLSELDQEFGTSIDLYLFGQIAKGRYDESDWPEGRVPPIPRVGKMDSAQFVFRREAIGRLLFRPNDYKADGHFVEALVSRIDAIKTYRVIEPLTQYNALALARAPKVVSVVEVAEEMEAMGLLSEKRQMPHFYQEIEGFFHVEPLYRRVVAEAPQQATFVEVGVWRGRSAAFMGVEIANSGKRINLHAIDTFTGAHDGSGSVSQPRYEEVVRTLEPLSNNVYVVRSASPQAATTYQDGSLDFVFLDADHQYGAVKRDIAAWLPKVKPGGLLAGDDYCYPGITGVKQAVDEMLPGAVVPTAFVEGVSGWWEYRKPDKHHDPKITAAPSVPISIITGLTAQGNGFIEETYQSLKDQTVEAWEWVIVVNRGGIVPRVIRQDPRVKIVERECDGFVGRVKRTAVEASRGRIIVELDHDDLLTPGALRDIIEAVDEEDASFVYSDFCEFNDKTWAPREQYRQDCGWRTYPTEYQGHKLVAHRAPPVTAQNIRFVDWAPNHVRAWTRASYERVGGHAPTMKFGDDHDLVVRYWLAGEKFVHIARPLYLYRWHEGNNVTHHIAEIRTATNEVYQRSIWKIAERWAEINRLIKVDLCGGIDPPPGYQVWDKSIPTVGKDWIECDLDRRWPADDSTVGLIRAHDAIEHLRDPVFTMNEAYRVLAPGGFLMIDVPSTNGPAGWSNPTYISFWNHLSFSHYTRAQQARYIPEFKGRFQVSRIIEWFPTPWHREVNAVFCEAQLIALKPGYEPMGFVWI